MELYVVIEREESPEGNNWVFGVFSTEEKANEIAEDLKRNFAENKETGHTAEVIKVNLDEPTADYEWFMCN